MKGATLPGLICLSFSYSAVVLVWLKGGSCNSKRSKNSWKNITFWQTLGEQQEAVYSRINVLDSIHFMSKLNQMH